MLVHVAAVFGSRKRLKLATVSTGSSSEEPHRVNGVSHVLLPIASAYPALLAVSVPVLVAIARPGAVTHGFRSVVRHTLRGMTGIKHEATTLGD